ncbi:MAG: hydantoinase/oxoprolinase family protein [Clostridiales bacterium]|nr:hydantoinase/oxoprolinase family protein [Clostridiales bacterium]
MQVGLGIDTGGTYTDGVLFNFDGQAVLQTAKALTRKEDLTVGIDEVLDQMDQPLLRQAALVALSTTLATNACVENKGGHARLVLIGCDRKIVDRYGPGNGLPPADDIILLAGGHDMAGQLVTEPDWAELKRRVGLPAGQADAYAVVELWGVRNTACESKARELLHGWTGKPVVCGHEISGTLNSLRRAASALLNARLLPLINAFLDAVRQSLDRRGIAAPLVIVRSDGSLMAESVARDKPVETLLSGPAASVAGGLALTGLQSGIVIDMGGTTSDIALVRQGRPVMAAEGAQIGSWRTGIRSIKIQTVGLGGDSLIRHHKNTHLVIGPRRAAPLSWAAGRYPQVLEQLELLLQAERKHTVSLAEFFYRVDKPGKHTSESLTCQEQRILDALAAGPLSLQSLADKTGSTIYNMKTERLEQQERIMRCGLTPTDIMHLTGDYPVWQRKAAEIGADIMALQLSVTRDDLVAEVQNKVKEMLGSAILEMLLGHEYAQDSGHNLSGVVGLGRTLLRQHMQPDGQDRFLQPEMACAVPLIGLGAPIHLFLPTVARFMRTEHCIPRHAAVANAVGAITGQVVATAEVLIKPRYAVAGITGYDGFSKARTCHFETHDRAVAWAWEQAEQEARQAAAERGARQADVQLSVDKRDAAIAAVRDETDLVRPQAAAPVYLETVVQARAIGRIDLAWL